MYEESFALFRELGNKQGSAYCLQQSALWLFVTQGDQATIRTRLEESLAISRELGNKEGIANYSWISGWVALSQGDTVTAQTLEEQSLALWQETGNRWSAFLPIAALGRIKAYQGDFAAALDFHEESLTRAREFNDYWLTAYCLEGWAIVVAAQGERAWAAHLWGAAESLRERCGIPQLPLERSDYELAVAAARTQLGAKAFESAWTEGRAMTLEQVLAAKGPVTVPIPVPTEQPSIPPAKPIATYPDGLTTREVEVLQLVAQGLTDAQIAERLIISTRTVNTHLTSIYGKIQVSSRSAAIRYAIEHQLVSRSACP